VVRNLPTGPQLRSASFKSANYTYVGPQVRILPVAGTLDTNNAYSVKEHKSQLDGSTIFRTGLGYVNVNCRELQKAEED